MSADTSAAGMARRVREWRRLAAAENDAAENSLYNACDLIDALAAERDALRDMLADRNALATDYAKVTAERDAAVAASAGAWPAYLRPSVARYDAALDAWTETKHGTAEEDQASDELASATAEIINLVRGALSGVDRVTAPPAATPPALIHGGPPTDGLDE